VSGIGDLFKEELGKLLDQAKDWTMEQRLLAAEIAESYADLADEIAVGTEVGAELDHLKAQVINLAAGAEQTGIKLFNQALEAALKILSKTLSIAL